jgi:hypothetical protein
LQLPIRPCLEMYHDIIVADVQTLSDCEEISIDLILLFEVLLVFVGNAHMLVSDHDDSLLLEEENGIFHDLS